MAFLSTLRRASRPIIWTGSSYFAYYLAIGCFMPYITLHYRQLGLSGGQIGLLTALPPLAIALLAPLWGVITDVRGAHRLVLRAALALSAIAALGIAQLSTFGQIAGLVGLLAISASPVASLLEGYGVTIGERTGVGYGRLRLWGSLGYIMAAFGLGLLMRGSISRLFLVAYAVALAVACAATFGLPPLGDRKVKPKTGGARRLLRRPAILVLLLTTYLMALSGSAIPNFLSIHIAALGGGTGQIGLANALAGTSEMPVLLFGAALASRLGSRRMIIMATLVYTLRHLGYSLAPGPSSILLLQLLHGLSFGANLVASVSLVHQLAGVQLAATGQGLLASSFSLGMITGALGGGALLDQIGTANIYRLAAGIAVLALGVFVVGSRLFAADEFRDAQVASSPATG